MRVPSPIWTLTVALLAVQALPVAEAQAPVPPVTATPAEVTQGRTAPAPRAAARARQSLFGEIHGKALDAAGGVMPRRVVRLRGTRTGQITDTTLTDDFGVFTFSGIEPGNYVVELVGDREAVLAASPLLTVDAGNIVSTTVKLPMRTSSLGGLLGSKVSTAAIIAGTAAAAGVLSVRVGNCVSPPCEN